MNLAIAAFTTTCVILCIVLIREANKKNSPELGFAAICFLCAACVSGLFI